jgi:hypothetical protein
MGGGVIGGFGLGLVMSAIVLAAVSLSTPLPDRGEGPAATEAPAEAAVEAAVEAATPEDAPDPVADPAPEPAPEPATPPQRADEPPAGDDAPQGAAAPVEATPPAEAALPEPPDAAEGTGPATAEPAEADPAPRVTLPRIEATPAKPAPGAPQGDDRAAQDPPSAVTLPAPSPEVAALPAQPGPEAVPPAPSPRFIPSTDAATPATLPRPLGPQAADGPARADTASAPTPATPPRVTLPQVVAPEPGPEPEPVPVPEAEAAPQAEPEPEPETRIAQAAPRRIVVPQPGDAPAAGRSLPQVTAALPESAAASPAEPPEAEPVATDALPNALRDNAAAFDAPAGGALMAVVLIDAPDSPFAPELLGSLSFPVSFAIDPLRPDAAARAAELRAAGFEVVIYSDGLIPEGAAPMDVETALAAARETLPQAVALMDRPDSRIQGDRPVLDATVAALADSGHGLLAFPQGLNAAEQSARRAEVPAATIFRLLDDEDQRATVITRFLGRAGFAAGQDGAVVVVGRTRPDTVTALFSWALGARSEQVTLAPVSAVLQRLAE